MMRFYKDLRKYFHYVKYAAGASLRAEVAGSYLNWLWWIFNPICMMIVYTVIFGYVFNAREQYFPCFIFVGLTLWDYFNRTLTTSVKIVKSRKSIVTKVYLPKFMLVLTELFCNAFKMMFSFGVIVAMMLVFRVPPSWRILWIFPILIIETLFVFGISCIVLHFGVFVEDLKNVIRILLRFVYYGTGIFFDIQHRLKSHPALMHGLIHYNPMAVFIVSARRSLLYNQPLELHWLLFWFVGSVILCVIGVRLIYKYENSYAKAI